MVDEIKLPKIVPSVSSAGRINRVKRGESNTKEERFDRQLHEEQEKEEETESEQGRGKTKLISAEDYSNQKESDAEVIKNEHGKLIDVVI